MTATTTNKLPADMTPAEQAFASRILDEETIRVTTTTETVYVIAVVTNKGHLVGEHFLTNTTLAKAQETARSTSDIMTRIGELEGKRIKLSRRPRVTRTITAFVTGERFDDEEDAEDPHEAEIATVLG